MQAHLLLFEANGGSCMGTRVTQDVVTAHFCMVHTDRSNSLSNRSAVFVVAL